MFIFWPVFAWTCLYFGFWLAVPAERWQADAMLWLAGAAVLVLLGWLTGLLVRGSGRLAQR
jgi:hypothetical protein